MSNSKPNPVANALRKAGYVPLPRLWVKKEDMPAIHQITDKHCNVVRDVRRSINGQPPAEPDPVTDRDAAWAAYERMRAGE